MRDSVSWRPCSWADRYRGKADALALKPSLIFLLYYMMNAAIHLYAERKPFRILYSLVRYFYFSMSEIKLIKYTQIINFITAY